MLKLKPFNPSKVGDHKSRFLNFFEVVLEFFHLQLKSWWFLNLRVKKSDHDVNLLDVIEL